MIHSRPANLQMPSPSSLVLAEHQIKMAGIVLKLPGHRVETQAIGGGTVQVATRRDQALDARKPHLFIHAGDRHPGLGRVRRRPADEYKLALG